MKTVKATKHHRLVEFIHSVQQIYSESKVIIVGCLASWLLCRSKFGLVWLIFILACCRTHYGLYIRRVKRIIRDEVNRYESRKILQRGESAEWMNIIVKRLWHLYERRLCAELVRYVNAELARNTDGDNPQRVVMHSVTGIERPLRITKIKSPCQPDSPNFFLEVHFQVDIEPVNGHQHLHFLDAPLIDMSIVHEHPDRKHNDLSVHVRQFTGSGVVQLEFDFRSMRPHLLRPHLEISEKPSMDCTIRTISQHHFPFHFAHSVDWRKTVERQIRDNLGRVFHQPLPLPFHLFGESVWLSIMRGLWHLHRYRDAL